ncbi:hypothetical protein MHU86_10584 [Fragilaria crotonensis]|nr:hypothetical protein MHU86_10584 [Fragilaria crotonensis]
MNQSNALPIASKPNSKLIDYTQQRRDDMPSRGMMVRSQYASSAPSLSLLGSQTQLRRKSSSTMSHSSSITNHDDTPDDDNAPIEFLFKKTFRQHKRSSDFSREELLVECEKRYMLEKEKLQQEQNGGDHAISSQDNVFQQNPRRRSSYESYGSMTRKDSKRSSHIDRILRTEISVPKTPDSKKAVRGVRRIVSEQGSKLGGEKTEKKPVASPLLERSKSDGPTALSTQGAKAA